MSILFAGVSLVAEIRKKLYYFAPVFNRSSEWSLGIYARYVTIVGLFILWIMMKYNIRLSPIFFIGKMLCFMVLCRAYLDIQ